MNYDVRTDILRNVWQRVRRLVEKGLFTILILVALCLVESNTYFNAYLKNRILAIWTVHTYRYRLVNHSPWGFFRAILTTLCGGLHQTACGSLQ